MILGEPLFRVPTFIVCNWMQTCCLGFVIQGRDRNGTQHAFLLLTTELQKRILSNVQAPTTFSTLSAAHHQCSPCTHPGPRFLYSAGSHLLSNIPGFSIDSGLLSSISCFQEQLHSYACWRWSFRGWVRWVECQFALFSPLLHAAGTYSV